MDVSVLIGTIQLCYSVFSKVVYLATTHQYIVNNIQLWLHVSVLPDHLQANVYYMEVHWMYLHIINIGLKMVW